MGAFTALSEREAQMAGTTLFGALDQRALRVVADAVERVAVRGGETLMREGEPGDCMYGVVSGRLRAFVRRPEGSSVLVGEIGRGETVGEMALLTGEPRSATVRAIRDSTLLRFHKTTFDRLVEEFPQVSMQLARLIVMRLQRAMRSTGARSVQATIAILPAGQDASISDFARSLTQALSAFGSTAHLTSERADAAVGPTATSSPDGSDN